MFKINYCVYIIKNIYYLKHIENEIIRELIYIK